MLTAVLYNQFLQLKRMEKIDDDMVAVKNWISTSGLRLSPTQVQAVKDMAFVGMIAPPRLEITRVLSTAFAVRFHFCIPYTSLTACMLLQERIVRLLLTPPGGPPPDQLKVAALKGAAHTACVGIARCTKQAMSIAFGKHDLLAEVGPFFDADPTPERVWFFFRVCYEFNRVDPRNWTATETEVNKHTLMPPNFSYVRDVLSFTGYPGNVLLFLRDLGVLATREEIINLRNQLRAVNETN
jgi:hypothetical protein